MSGPAVPTLPAHWYHDPAVHDRERERIFARHWTPIVPTALVEEIGAFACSRVAGQPVVVVRTETREVRGFHNVCRHRAAPVAPGDTGRVKRFRCPYHGWVYGLDGALLGAPGFDSPPPLEPPVAGLLPIATETWNGVVFARLAADGPPLTDWLGEIVDVAEAYPDIGSMRYARTVVREAAVDWKAYGDNSAEGYHLPLVHPGLTRAVGDASVAIEARRDGEFVGFDVRYHGASDVRSGRSFWIYKFPGVLIHLGNGSANVERVEPVGPGRIRLTRWFWFAEDFELDREAAIRESAGVMDEDLEICAAVQRNLAAGAYRRGVLSPEREPGTIYIQSLIREALGDPD